MTTNDKTTDRTIEEIAEMAIFFYTSTDLPIKNNGADICDKCTDEEICSMHYWSDEDNDIVAHLGSMAVELLTAALIEAGWKQG